MLPALRHSEDGILLHQKPNREISDRNFELELEIRYPNEVIKITQYSKYGIVSNCSCLCLREGCFYLIIHIVRLLRRSELYIKCPDEVVF